MVYSTDNTNQSYNYFIRGFKQYCNIFFPAKLILKKKKLDNGYYSRKKTGGLLAILVYNMENISIRFW